MDTVLRRTVSYKARSIFFARKGIWLKEKAVREQRSRRRPRTTRLLIEQ